MSEYIEQSSASDRYEAARKALAAYDESLTPEQEAYSLAEALRALITPPGVGESEDQIARRMTDDVMTYAQMEGLSERGIAMAGLRYGIRAGIQNAHETWEPEVAMQPTQEQMLRWLGLDHKEATDDEGEPSIYVFAQHIEREEF